MSELLPKPLGSALTPLLSYLNIPHTPLHPDEQYTLSTLSDNLRTHRAACLRCHIPRTRHRDQLRYLTTLNEGDFLLIGRHGNAVAVGLLQTTSSGMVLHIDGNVVPLGGVQEVKRHPLEDYFECVQLVYYLKHPFVEEHLVLPFLYRRRKVRQLRKVIEKQRERQKLIEKRRVRGEKAWKKAKAAKEKIAKGKIAKGKIANGKTAEGETAEGEIAEDAFAKDATMKNATAKGDVDAKKGGKDKKKTKKQKQKKDS